MGTEDGIWDLWVLSKRRIIADSEEMARARLVLRDNEEVISVGYAPVLTTSPVLTVALCSPPLENIRPDLPPLEEWIELEDESESIHVNAPGKVGLIQRVKRALHLDKDYERYRALLKIRDDLVASGALDVVESEPPKNPPKLPDSPNEKGWNHYAIEQELVDPVSL